MNPKLEEQLSKYALQAADILLPKKDVDYYKWAVVACDQFTSQVEYWEKVKEIIKDSPSTYNLIYPECYLESANREEIIKSINENMEKFLKDGIFDTYKSSFILVERSSETGCRYGLVAALDLEAYSYATDSRSLVRATEGTILSRIPPRKEIRKNAPLELPHIMVLISDEKRAIIEPLVAKRAELEKVYDTDLMLGGGHATGYLVNSDEDIKKIIDGLDVLYHHLDKDNPILYAMGDGNHSLATAKSLYEDLKAEVGEEEAKKSPSRYALVEIENIFDPALAFEAIHRVFFSLDTDSFNFVLEKFCDSYCVEDAKDLKTIEEKINEKDGYLKFGLIVKDRYLVYKCTSENLSLSASLIQNCIDLIVSRKMAEIDYIHGAKTTEELAQGGKNIGIILPDISKETFFDDIKKDGSFPRKTFSIGHSEEKRYYMEARRIR